MWRERGMAVEPEGYGVDALKAEFGDEEDWDFLGGRNNRTRRGTDGVREVEGKVREVEGR